MKELKHSALFIFAFLLLITFGSVPSIRTVAANTFSNHVYLPIVIKPICSPNAEEMAIANLMINDAGQGRSQLTCNPILEQVARQKALDMGTRGYFGHTSPDGIGPNYLVTQAGYVLPSFYASSLAGNSIESIAAGKSTVPETWAQWIESPSHKRHILGETSFFADQVEYGVGYVSVPGSPFTHYWVVLTAKPGP